MRAGERFCQLAFSTCIKTSETEWIQASFVREMQLDGNTVNAHVALMDHVFLFFVFWVSIDVISIFYLTLLFNVIVEFRPR